MRRYHRKFTHREQIALKKCRYHWNMWLCLINHRAISMHALKRNHLWLLQPYGGLSETNCSWQTYWRSSRRANDMLGYSWWKFSVERHTFRVQQSNYYALKVHLSIGQKLHIINMLLPWKIYATSSRGIMTEAKVRRYKENLRWEVEVDFFLLAAHNLESR